MVIYALDSSGALYHADHVEPEDAYAILLDDLYTLGIYSSEEYIRVGLGKYSGKMVYRSYRTEKYRIFGISKFLVRYNTVS